MTGHATLHGMAWDHPRAIEPLNAVGKKWSTAGNATVEWDARSLKAFEDQPLDELTERYDLVLIDHPFVGTAAESGLILAVDEWSEESYLANQRANSVGPSFESYTWKERQWALAIDAACQVSAVREDLWDHGGLGEQPDTWREVRDIAASLTGSHGRVAIALNPNHAYCAFLSVAMSNAGDSFWPVGQLLREGPAIEALEFLRELGFHLHPSSGDSDPIAISDLMAETDEIIYCPLMFGYSNYAREGFSTHRLRFANAPAGPSGRRGSVLGGVGIALSAQSHHPDLAADLARLVASESVQQTTYVEAGGQPGHLKAWQSAKANELVAGFFENTIATMRDTFIRPRIPGHRRFQQEAGAIIHSCIWSRELTSAKCFERLQIAVERHL